MSENVIFKSNLTGTAVSVRVLCPLTATIICLRIGSVSQSTSVLHH